MEFTTRDIQALPSSLGMIASLEVLIVHQCNEVESDWEENVSQAYSSVNKSGKARQRGEQ
eukprot:1859892-Amphidinium_carterae.1